MKTGLKSKKRLMKKNKKMLWSIFALFIVLILIIAIGWYKNQAVFTTQTKTNARLSSSDQNQTSEKSSSSKSSVRSSTSTSTSSSSSSDLPQAHQSDWDLIIVNKNNPKGELNPPLAQVDGKDVNARIAQAAAAFLAAAKSIDPDEHFISGYRSVAYQSQLYNMYVAQEMSGDGTVNSTGKEISKAQAIQNVNTYSQPAGMSEHNTGLAIDMSTVDSLNASDPTVVQKVMAIAPHYGFVLHFQKGMEASTGVDYEDWHYRYVGVENATYMTAHHLSLEQYVALLPK